MLQLHKDRRRIPRDSRADDSLISRPVIGRRNQNRQAAAHLLSGTAKT
jgi:hypothetical protein